MPFFLWTGSLSHNAKLKTVIGRQIRPCPSCIACPTPLLPKMYDLIKLRPSFFHKKIYQPIAKKCIVQLHSGDRCQVFGSNLGSNQTTPNSPLANLLANRIWKKAGAQYALVMSTIRWKLYSHSMGVPSMCTWKQTEDWLRCWCKHWRLKYGIYGCTLVRHTRRTVES